MGLDFIGTIIIILYFVGLVAIGALASKKIKNSEDFLVAGRNLGFWTFTLLIVASICSGMTILGVAGLGYAAGWPSIWEQIFVPLSAAVCILFFGTKLHSVASRTGYVTVQDYFAHRFYSPKRHSRHLGHNRRPHLHHLPGGAVHLHQHGPVMALQDPL